MPRTLWRSGDECSYLKELFEQWGMMHKKYTAELEAVGVSKAYGWWTNERANIGFIAAATWKLGGVALEEYPAERAEGEEDNNVGGAFFPRVDLYAQVTLDNELRYIIIESKMYIYQEGIRPDIITRRIKRRLDEADEQFERVNLREKDDCDLYAVCFVILKFTTQHTNDEIEENMEGVFDSIMNDRGEACFLTTYLVDDPIVYGGYNYPGIAVFGWRLDA